MSRSFMGIVAGLVVLGCVVAMLPAQESSRRTATKYRPSSSGPGERPSLAPLNPADAELPPVVNAPSRSAASSTQGNYVPAQQLKTTSNENSPGNTAVPQDPVGTQALGPSTSPAGIDQTPAELDDSRLHSVLKRPQTPARSAYDSQTQARSASELNMQARSASELNIQARSASELNIQARSASEGPGTNGALSSAGATAGLPGELPRRAISSVPANSSLSSSAIDSNQNPKSKIQNSTTSATSKSAALKVEITGPQGITVGKPALYVVTVNNESDTAAEEVQLRIPLPSFITVQTTQPTSGEASVQPDAAGAARLMWLVPRVAARSREQLKVQLLTGVGDGFELAAEWTVRPVVAKAAIVVKQPQLALSLNGPAEMVYGEEKAFTLTVSNPGTGDAERVVVSVTAANAPPQQFDAGLIPAGHKKEVPLAVVASQAGTIELQISAAGEGGLEARTAGKVIVRKAEVNLAIDGPPMKYAGAEAIYIVTVSNSGTAAADNINLSLALPAGAKYLGGIEGATQARSASEGPNSNAGGPVRWKISNLPARQERQYEVRLQLSSPGTNHVAVQSQAAASGTANCAADTQVEAISDLKLLVQDPSGPMPTDEPATYELQIMNRGTQAARQVRVVVQFSDGVEPVAFEGCEARIVPGQLDCHPLPSLGPGEQATVRVKAKAMSPGSHHFRVEVTDGDARLVSEGTTRFFVETGRAGAAASTARKPTLVPNTSIPTTVR